MRHLRYGGSTMKRTLNCSGWRKLADQLPESKGSSDWADEGTLLHNCAEEFFVKSTSVETMLNEGRHYDKVELTTEMVTDRLIPAIEAVQELLDEYDIGEYICEPFVELIPGQAGGSIDMLAISADGKTAIVIDYKFGVKFVEVDYNEQALFYALCADVDENTTGKLAKVETLVLAIVQPMHSPVCRTAEYPIAILDDFEDRTAAAIYNAENVDIESEQSRHAALKAGPWCSYCPAEAICDIKTGQVLKAMHTPPDSLVNLPKAVEMADELEDWIKAVRKLAHERLEQGLPVKGFKLVNKRASRVYADEAAVVKYVTNARKIKKAEAYDYKLKSPAQLEKVFKLKGLDFAPIAENIVSVSSGTTMVKESDKRPAVIPGAALKALSDKLKS